MSEKKNIKRNSRRVGSNEKPKFGYGGRLWFPTANMTIYEIYLLKKGLY